MARIPEVIRTAIESTIMAKHIVIDEATRTRVVIAKTLYHEAAIGLTEVSSVVRRIAAIVLLDTSVESLIKTTLSALDSTKKSPDSKSYSATLTQVKDALSKKGLGNLPAEGKVQRLHKIRNSVQHDGIVPDVSDAVECRAIARDFLEELVQLVWGISFGSISRVELIKNPMLNELLKKAESAMDAGEYQEATEHCVDALDRALADSEVPFVGEKPSWTLDSIMAKSWSSPPAPSKELLESHLKMRRVTAMMALGMDVSTYVRFTIGTGRLIRYADGTHGFRHSKQAYSKEDAEFAIAFCTDSIIEIEKRVGELAKPFGMDYFDLRRISL